MTEEALRAAGYQAPTLSADKGAELDALQVSNDMARYLAAVEEYNRLMDDRKTIRYRASVVIANFWHKCWGGVVLMIATTCLTIGLCAQDVPTWVVRGIAAVETGTDYRGVGDVRGPITRGQIGEVGPWQLSPAVLKDLGAYNRRGRVHSDVVLAESLTRAWLVRLYRVTGNWPSAIAAYHAGLGRRTRPFAIQYAERVRAAGVL